MSQHTKHTTHTMGVSVKFSPALLARLDSIAAGWGLDRSATLRRLVEIADVEAAAPLEVPSMDELVRIAAEKARGGKYVRGGVVGGPPAR